MDISPYTRKVQYYETDQMGIVHHSNYIRWFEEAQVDFLEQIGFGYQKAIAVGIDFAVLGVSCEYKSMIRFGDTVKTHLCVTSLEALRMTLSYRIVDGETEMLRAMGTSKHCYYHSLKKQPAALRKELPELYEILKSVEGCSPDI